MKARLFIFSIFFSFITLCNSLTANPFTPTEKGQILFLVQQGKIERALELYQQQLKENTSHDYELLSQIGLALLSYGAKQTDLEMQVLTLFGAHVSANSEAYFIIKECLKSRHPQIQSIALNCLADSQQDDADEAIIHMLGSPYALLRFEAIAYLCKKKDPFAIDQLESLIAKSPTSILPLYPPLLAELGTRKSMHLLRKMVNHPLNKVRQAVIFQVANKHRDDFLPQIRQQALHFDFAQQEVCAYALGLFKDEESIEKLQILARSQYSETALAARWALFQLGKKNAALEVEQMAKKGNLYAIHLLAPMMDHQQTLMQLLDHKDLQIRLNAQLSLLEIHHEAALKGVEKLLVKDQYDLGFSIVKSPGEMFQAWKVVFGASELFKEDLLAYQTQLEFKEAVLSKIKEISEETFLKIASLLLDQQQNELIPKTVALLEELKTSKAISCLQNYQQKLGAALVRNYCNLTLYKMGEPGPYAAQLKQWIKAQKQLDLIQFRSYDPWKATEAKGDLTPAESSRLLVSSFQTFAERKDREGIELLVDLIATGNKKNRYALAGLLLRAVL